MAYGLRNKGRPFAPTRQIGLDRLWQNPIAYRVHELSLRTLPRQYRDQEWRLPRQSTIATHRGVRLQLLNE